MYWFLLIETIFDMFQSKKNENPKFLARFMCLCIDDLPMDYQIYQ